MRRRSDIRETGLGREEGEGDLTGLGRLRRGMWWGGGSAHVAGGVLEP